MFKLLKRSDINATLVDQTIYILWPDNQTWYAATVDKVSSQAGNSHDGDSMYSELGSAVLCLLAVDPCRHSDVLAARL